METWKAMYLIIWVAFFQILFVLFSPLGDIMNLAIHVVIAVAILGLAFTIYRGVTRTSCPARIKRITKTTWYLAIFQGVLGMALALGVTLSWGSIYVGLVSFLHVANALAIITQASSSATAYDMWEEKEFQVPLDSSPNPSPSKTG
jgi:large-conductance mechanosensitive channel